jgi:dolichol-phosphate mannosyltransferase
MKGPPEAKGLRMEGEQKAGFSTDQRRVSLDANLIEMERARESYWQRYGQTSPTKLRWRALTVRHCFHVLPGQTILELGAGTGLWTQHLTAVLRHQNPITAAVFNADFAEHSQWQSLQNVERRLVQSLDELPAESFDFIVGTAMLCHKEYPYNLRGLYRLLKPGGQLLFFEANFWNPQVLLKTVIPPFGRWCGNASCQVGLRRYRLMLWASQAGFSHLDAVPYDIIHPLIPRRLVPAIQSLAFIFEHMPVVKELCGTLCIRARRPGGDSDPPPAVDLAEHAQFRDAVSFVVPCHNEEANVRPLVETLVRLYDSYIHEIIIVNDNSKDRTAEVTREIALREPRVKLVDRKPPNGVGLTLRDGYAAATGRYIFTMDADFVHIVPEFRDLFDAVAEGYDGAVGSRFTKESIMVNYPFFKILCNRSFHLLANLLLPCRIHDISNNLKLYRAEILKEMAIAEPHFAANAEIGLKAILAGYRIREVPISWINRTIEMGSSTFRIAKVAPNYFGALMALVRTTRFAPRSAKTAAVSRD